MNCYKYYSNISISKFYAAQKSACQAFGTIDISTRELLGIQELGAGVKVGFNTNAIRGGVGDNFKISPNSENVNFGFYSRELGLC